MELRQIEYFVKIADTGSINEAARRLNMSQPPLSFSMRQLEAELGAELFVRSSKGVELTKAGRLLYERAETLLEFARSTKKEVSEAGKRRVLRIGITSSTVPTVLPLISEFVGRYPDVSFEVHDGSSYTLLQLLLDGIIDISVARTPLRLDSVDSLVLSCEPMIAVSPSGSAHRALPERSASSGGEEGGGMFFRRCDNVKPKDATPGKESMCDSSGGEEGAVLEELTDRPLILYRRYEELICSAFAARGLSPNVFCVCDDARDAMLWVGAGLATAIFPASMRSMCSGMYISTLAEPVLETKTLLISKKGVPLAPVARDFMAVCREGMHVLSEGAK